MNQNMTFERKLAAYMAEEAGGRAPERLVDDVLFATSRTRPDPRWLALLKEPPMRTQTRVVVGMPTRRLILAMAAAALLLLALVAAIVGANLVKPSPQTAGDDWPMYRGDAARTGISVRGPTGHPVVAWQFRASGALSHGISIVADTVYASSDDGVVHALAVANGNERWHVTVAQGPTSDPAVFGNSLYLGDAAGVVRALDRSSGTERWRTSQLTAPVTMGGDQSVLLVGTGDGLLVAFDPATGTERWRTTLSTTGGKVSAAAIAEGVVYVGTEKAGVHALSASTGQALWHVDTGSATTGTAVVANGLVYIGSSADTENGRILALEPGTGRTVWRIDEPFQAPAVGADTIFMGSLTGDIIAADSRTGAITWRTQIQSPLHPMAVVGNVLYVPSDHEHRVLALDATTGGELWSLPVDGPIQCCVAVAKGSLFVGTNAGTIYSIGGDGAALTAASVRPIEPSQAASETPNPTVSPTPTPAQVKVLWSVSPPDHGYNANASIGIDRAGNTWLPDHVNNRFSIISPDGRFIENWGKSGKGEGEFILSRPNGDGYGGIAFAPDGSFFVLDTGNRRVEKFDAHRRFVKAWGGFGSGPGHFDDPVGITVGPGGVVYVLDDVRMVVEKYDQDGKVLGSFEAFPNAPANFGSNGFTVDADGSVYVGQVQPNQVAVFDPNGTLVRTLGTGDDFRFSEQPGQIAVDGAGRVFVTQGPERGDAMGVVAFGADGRFLGGFGPREGADLTLHFPTGMVLDRSGALVLQDAGPIEAGTHDKGRLMKIELPAPLAK